MFLEDFAAYFASSWSSEVKLIVQITLEHLCVGRFYASDVGKRT